MKLSNIRNMRFNSDTRTLYADVDVTTGFLWWRQTNTRQVFATALNEEDNSGMWAFLDGSGYTPGFQCEILAKAAKARNGLPQ